MSAIYRKINYVDQGEYGTTVDRTLYVKFDATSDIVTVCDDNQNILLVYNEWGFGKQLDLGQALCKLLSSSVDTLESCTIDEIQKIFKH